MLLKTLRLIKSGLISHQTFPQEQIHSPFFSQANYSYESEGLNLTYGMFYFFLDLFEKVVFEVHNKYVPQTGSDLGGISVIKGEFLTNLYEYVNSVDYKSYNYTRVYKNNYNYYGEGSEDGNTWIYKETIQVPKADAMGVSVQGQQPYTIQELKLYTDPCFYIFNVYNGYIINIYDLESTLLKTININNVSIGKVQMPLYPFSGYIEVIDDKGVLVSYQQINDIWGGDEFSSTLDIDLFDDQGRNLHLEEAKHLGYVKRSDPIYEVITAVNNTGAYLEQVSIRVMEESPAYDWVYLNKDEFGNNTYVKEIFIDLPPYGSVNFLLRIQQPTDYTGMIGYNPNEEDVFYLDVGGDGDSPIPSEGFLFAPVGMSDNYVGKLTTDGVLNSTDILYK